MARLASLKALYRGFHSAKNLGCASIAGQPKEEVQHLARDNDTDVNTVNRIFPEVW